MRSRARPLRRRDGGPASNECICSIPDILRSKPTRPKSAASFSNSSTALLHDDMHVTAGGWAGVVTMHHLHLLPAALTLQALRPGRKNDDEQTCVFRRRGCG